jgi:tetratricopeptide (TPR) repeat protein/transcriptional regulator with XRE-family HTH domain
MARRSAGKAYRDQQRERLARLGVHGRQLIEQLVTDLMRCGCRPREAWRLAHELTQDEIATRFDRIRGDPNVRMRGSRICEYEKWPTGGVRPSVRTLKILADIYETTWDQLIDVDDLEEMSARDRQAFLDISDLRHGDSLDLPVPRYGGRRPAAPHSGGDPRVDRLIVAGEPATVRERLTIPARGRSGGGLPGEATHFTGRDRPMAELRAQITEQGPRGTVVRIYAIDGMAGVGKTAFARHAAQEFGSRYKDGGIWVDLFGHTPGMQPREAAGALEQMLLQLGVPPEAIKADLADRQDQWRRHIHPRRMLIVLDNARTSDQVLPLLPEAPDCLVLITSRRKLTGLTDAYPLSLDVLGWGEAEQLFIKLVGPQRCEDREAVGEILAACGRLPLAIRLIAGWLRHHTGELLAEVAADFADQTAALDTFSAEHVSVRAAFEWSYQLLTDEQRRAFRLLGWHPGPEITPVVIAAVADVPPGRGRRLLRELVDHNLLEQLSAAGVAGGPRYRMHDLVRLYALERADAEEPPAERAAAVDRLASKYLAITRKADRLLRPYASGDPGRSTDRGTVLTFANASQARTWLTVERHNLLGCVRTATDAAELSTVLAVHFRDFGFWSDVRYLHGQALIIYRHLVDRRGEVDALWGLGEVAQLLGEYDQARKHYTESLTLARHLGYRNGEVDALWGLGEDERLVGECGRAREYYTQALILARHHCYRRAEADVLWGLGQVERLVADYRQAREYHTQALTLARQLGYRFGEADALWGLGQVERLVGEYGRAREYYTQALTLARQLGYRRAEVEALRGLGQVERLIAEYGRAREYYTQALALARHLGYRRAEADALRGLGQVERRVGEYGQARECDTQALALARHLGDRRVEADALWGLGEVERLVGEYGRAREYDTQALTVARHFGYRRVEADALRGLGQVERLVGEYGQAREHHTRALTLARQLGYRFGEAGALWGLGLVERLVGDYGQARIYHCEALVLARHLGDRRVEADALRGLGEVERLVGEYGQAREYHRQALALARRVGYRRAEAEALRGLGEVERLVGEYGQAREYHRQALALARHLGDRPGEVLVLRGLGEVERLVGDHGQARECYFQALALARQLGYRYGEVLVLRGLGEIERLVGDYGQAREYHTQALILARQLGYRYGEILALRGLGEVERLVGDYGLAREYHTQALTLARQLGDRPGKAEALWGLGHVASDTAERDQARDFWRKALEVYEELGVPFAETVRTAIFQLD